MPPRYNLADRPKLIQVEPARSKDEKKIPKEAVLYAFRPETQYTCDKCVFAKTVDGVLAKKCAVFGPAPDIQPFGSCGFWLHRDPRDAKGEIPYLGIVTPEEAGYDENKTGFSCKRCEYFAPGMDCEKVDKDSPGDTPGQIHPNACCNNWDADDVRAKLPPEKLAKVIEAMNHA